MSLHVMIDLESLSTRPDAAVIQIAALAFDPLIGASPEVWRPKLYPTSFNVFVADFEGRHVDPQTVAWWLQRGEVACRVGEGMAAGSPLPAALRDFSEWYEGLCQYIGAVEGLWSHGATFDIPILEHAFKDLARQGLRTPWSYKLPRDTRTLYALTPGGMPALDKADPEREHDAAYDCERQVAAVVEAVRRIRAAGLEVSL